MLLPYITDNPIFMHRITETIVRTPLQAMEITEQYNCITEFAINAEVRMRNDYRS